MERIEGTPSRGPTEYPSLHRGRIPSLLEPAQPLPSAARPPKAPCIRCTLRRTHTCMTIRGGGSRGGRLDASDQSGCLFIVVWVPRVCALRATDPPQVFAFLFDRRCKQWARYERGGGCQLSNGIGLLGRIRCRCPSVSPQENFRRHHASSRLQLPPRRRRRQQQQPQRPNGCKERRGGRVATAARRLAHAVVIVRRASTAVRQCTSPRDRGGRAATQ